MMSNRTIRRVTGSMACIVVANITIPCCISKSPSVYLNVGKLSYERRFVLDLFVCHLIRCVVMTFPHFVVTLYMVGHLTFLPKSILSNNGFRSFCSSFPFIVRCPVHTRTYVITQAKTPITSRANLTGKLLLHSTRLHLGGGW